MNTPLVSVVIPTYNRADLVLKAIKSVLGQTFTDFEVLVCDDGSTDNTEEAIKSINHGKIRYLKQENKGPGAARNLGIKHARGEIISFLDSDDLWLSDHLKYVVEFFELYLEAGMVYTNSEIVFSDDSRRQDIDYSYKRIEIPHAEKKKRFWLYDGLVFDYYLERHMNATPCTSVKREVFDAVGMFNEEMSSAQDMEMWIRIANKFRVGVVKKVTVHILAQKNSISETVSTYKHNKNHFLLHKSILESCDLTEKQKADVLLRMKDFEAKMKEASE